MPRDVVLRESGLYRRPKDIENFEEANKARVAVNKNTGGFMHYFIKDYLEED